jgi:hypothetical protein
MSMADNKDEQYQTEAQGCFAGAKPHFCSCRDVACLLNPNNPKNRAKGRGCDGCIRKCLAQGEIPSCFFNEVGTTQEGWDDYTYAGFCRHCEIHGVE